nr:transcription factor myc4 [Quercus suber]
MVCIPSANGVVELGSMEVIFHSSDLMNKVRVLFNFNSLEMGSWPINDQSEIMSGWWLAMADDSGSGHDLDAQTSYDGIFSKRRLYLERDVTLSELQFTCIHRIFESRGWISLASGFPAPPTNLIHEFYSNIHDITKDGSFSVMVRNISFEVTPDLVSTVLGIPRVMESPYPCTAGTAPSQTDMLTLFCGEHTIWPHGILKVKSASFIPEYRWLNRRFYLACIRFYLA